eukprot:5922310-Alexandrium_andersonii.AAC.1
MQPSMRPLPSRSWSSHIPSAACHLGSLTGAVPTSLLKISALPPMPSQRPGSLRKTSLRTPRDVILRNTFD